MSEQRTRLLSELNQEARWQSVHSVLLSQLAASRAGLDPTTIEAFDVLQLSGPITAGRLGELTGLTSSSVTSLIDRLVAAGLARREADPADRRRVVVRPLPVPESIEEAVGPIYREIGQGMDDIYARYSEAELALLRDFLRRTNEMTAHSITALRHPRRGGG